MKKNLFKKIGAIFCSKKARKKYPQYRWDILLEKKARKNVTKIGGIFCSKKISSKLKRSGLYIGGGTFRRRRFGAADSALDNSAPCRFGARHFGAVS